MMKFKLLVGSCLVLLSLAVVTAQQSANFGQAKFAPEDGKKLFIIGQDLGSVGGLASYRNGYIDLVDADMPAGVTSYTSINNLGGLTTLANWGAGDVRAQSYVDDSDFDNSVIVIGLYLVGILDQIVAGDKDQEIREFANWVKGQDRPIFIRIGYEFEGPWNNYDPDEFKLAWRYIVHRFDELQVRNAAYVWQSAGLNYSNIQRWYPGDEYVNWFGYSQFDGQNMGISIRNLARSKGKPVMIAEATPKIDLGVGDGQSHWDQWFERVFDEIYADDDIKAFAYINADWDSQPMWEGQGWGDSRVQINTTVHELWVEEMNKEPWLFGNEDLFDELDYRGWITSVSDIDRDRLDLRLTSNAGSLHVSFDDAAEIDEVAVFDQSGRMLMRQESCTSCELRFNYDTTQIYHIIVRSDGATLTRKILLDY